MRLWYVWWSGHQLPGAVRALVIRAESESRARALAVEETRQPPAVAHDWQDRNLALIAPLTEDGDEEVISEERGS